MDFLAGKVETISPASSERVRVLFLRRTLDRKVLWLLQQLILMVMVSWIL